MQQQQNTTNKIRIEDWKMDRILKEWENDLEKHVSSFVKHSQQIKHWDQVIFQNSTKVLQLQNEVANVMNHKCS